MTKDPLEAVLDTHRENARLAIAEAFGTVQISAITRLSGGASPASAYRVDIGSRSYLLRAEGLPSPLRNPHQYIAMKIAAEAGIAPKIHFFDEVTRIAVIDFIEQKTLDGFSGGPRALAQELGELLARVQDTPIFPFFVNYPEIVERLFAHVRRTGQFAAGLLDPYVERLGLLSEVYHGGTNELVSSHNDFIPSNILFDGERLWLIDWESAYRNDPLVDVAIGLDGLVRSQELAGVFLSAWLGRTPDAALQERLAVVRALTRLYYAGVFLSASAAASWNLGDTDLSAPTLDSFQAGIRARRLLAGTPQTKHILGKMYLASFMSGVEAPGFDAAV